MRHGVVLFSSDRGITPSQAARAAEAAGFDCFYVPEHTHIPVRRDAAHPRTGTAELPDDRYLRTLDPWVALSMAALAHWAQIGVTDVAFGMPDRSPGEVIGYLGRLAGKLGLPSRDTSSAPAS